MTGISVFVGLDLGGTALKAALVDPNNGISVEGTHVSNTPRTGSPDELAESLIEAALLVADGRQVQAVGVGVPGQFDTRSGTLRALPNVPGQWGGFPIRKRLAVYREQTAPLVAYYRGRGLLREVDGRGDIDDVFARVCRLLGAEE